MFPILPMDVDNAARSDDTHQAPRRRPHTIIRFGMETNWFVLLARRRSSNACDSRRSQESVRKGHRKEIMKARKVNDTTVQCQCNENHEEPFLHARAKSQRIAALHLLLRCHQRQTLVCQHCKLTSLAVLVLANKGLPTTLAKLIHGVKRNTQKS